MATFWKKFLVVLLVVVSIWGVYGRYPKKFGIKKASFHKLDLENENIKNVKAKSFGSKSQLNEITPKIHRSTNDGLIRKQMEQEHFENLATIPRLAKNLLALQYWITIQPYFTSPNINVSTNLNNTFDGYTKIRFNMTADSVNVTVDALRLSFTAVNLYMNGVRQQLISSSFDSNANRLTVAPVLFLKAGQTYELEFNYTGLINDYMVGGLFSTFWRDANWQAIAANRFIIATFFEIGSGARSVFPCFDDPSFKAQFTLTLIYPTVYQALSNTMANTTVNLNNGYSLVTFETTPIMSTYLVAFAIGDLINRSAVADDGTQLGVWVWNGPGMSDRISVAMNTTLTCYNALRKYINVSLPLKKMDHLALPFFSYGGMENWGLIIYDAGPVLFHNQEDTTAERVSGIQTRCHEMAHQWFGDLVTNEWWSEIMLHESLADYFETFSIGLMYNMTRFADHLYVVQTQEGVLKYDYGPNTHPLIVPDGSFDDITYAKGGSLLRQLAFTMGATGYQRALQRYLTNYQFGNANHNQFFEQFTAVARESSITDWCGNFLNVSVLMDSWVNVPHYPAITVALGDGGHSYIAGQQPFLPPAYLPANYTYSWIIPTRVLEYEIPFAISNQSVWIAPNNTQCTNFAPFKTRVETNYDHYDVFNEGGHSYARVIYDEGAHNRIRRLVVRDNGTLSTNTHIRLISDEWAIIDRDMVTLGVPPRLHRGLQILQSILTQNTTVHYTTFYAANNVLDSLFELSADRHEFDLYLRLFVPILTNFYNNFGGWNNTNADFGHGMLKNRMLHYAVRFNIGDARAQALQYWNNRISTPIDPDLRRAVYCAAMLNDSGTNFAVLRDLFNQSEMNGYYTSREINSIAQGLACAQNPFIIQRIIDLFAERSSSSHRYYLHSSVLNFGNNQYASDAMHDYLISASTNINAYYLILDGIFCLRGDECVLYYYLLGMTNLWYTDTRLQQFRDLNQTIYTNLKTNLSLADEYVNAVVYFFNYIYVNNLLPANARGAYTYADLTRWLYDNYVPFGATPWLQQLTSTFTPVQYDLQIRPYFPSSYRYNIGQNFTFDGNMTINATKIGPSTSISFNSHRHMINHLRVYLANGTQLSTTQIPWNIPPIRDYDNSIVTITLTQPIQAGTSIFIVVNYTGLIVNNPSEGDYMNWDYLEWSKQQSWIFATDFEAGPGTRSIAPCYDEPRYKAIWKITVDYSTDMVALSNSLEEKIVNLGNGLSRTIFKPTPPMASYLVAISVGDFASVRGVTQDKKLVRVWTWTGMQNNGELSLRATIDTINYLTTTMNKSLPLEKVDVLALPQYTGSAAGAMENWGLIISGYLECLWNPEYSTTLQLTDTYWTTSHETTHQWFGDLVTFDWWNYIFLNEGFATYWPTIIMNVTYNQTEWAHAYRFTDQEYALRNDGNNDQTRPVIVPADQLRGWCVFCYQSYAKASSLIFQIEQTIHRQNFDKALQNYLNVHEFNSAIDTDLFEKFTETAMADYPNIYDWNQQPLNVTNYVKPFFYLQTNPVIKVVTTSDGLTFSYQQTPFLQGLQNAINMSYLWNIPLFTDPPSQNINWLISQKSLDNSVSGSWNIVNPRRRVYARVWYDDLSWAPIQTQIQANLSVFDPITRAAFISDNWVLANQQNVSWSRVFNLIKYAANVPEYATWDVVNRIFDELLTVFKFTADNPKLTTFVLSILNAPSQQSLLFSHTGNWANDITAVYITGLSCYLGSTNCLNNASATFNTFIANCQNSAYGTGRCNQVPPDHRDSQMCWGLRQNPGSASAVFNLVQWYITNAQMADYWRNDAVTLLSALSCLTDDSVVNSYLNLTLYDQLPAEFFRYVAESDSSGMRLFNFFQNNLLKIVNSRHFDGVVSNLAFGWSTNAQLSLLQNFNWNGIVLTNEQGITWYNTVGRLLEIQGWLYVNQAPISAWLNANV